MNRTKWKKQLVMEQKVSRQNDTEQTNRLSVHLSDIGLAVFALVCGWMDSSLASHPIQSNPTQSNPTYMEAQ